MNYNTDLDQAVRYLKLTLPEMSKYSVPATPSNYAVWYEYTIGHNKKLITEIDSIIRSGRNFSDETNDDLYQRFIADGGKAAIDHIRDGVRQVINDLLDKIGDEENGLSSYSTALSMFNEQVKSKTDAEDIQFLIGQIVQETRRREESAEMLNTSLQSMTKEIQSLRKEIELLSEEASTDPLTKLANRRAFDIGIEKAVENADISTQPLSLLMVDIDHFKKVNDTHGHVIGDKIIRFVASALKQQTKGKDTVARYGGEEFAVILPETGVTGAKAVAENLCKIIAAQILTDSAEKKKLGSITVSVGSGTFETGETIEQFIERTDRALYAAKQGGRNQVKTAEASTIAQ